MSRMYFSFQTNFEPSNDDLPSPVVDYISFKHKETGEIIDISCNYESDFEVDKNRVYQARFKGLDFGEWEMTDKGMEWLKNAVPVGMQIYVPDYCPRPENIIISDIDIDIEHNDGTELHFQTDKVEVEFEIESFIDKYAEEKEDVER